MYRRSIILIILIAGRACPADVSTLSGKKYVGELKGVSSTGITIKSSSGDIAVPVADLLYVDLQTESPIRDAAIEVELADGSVLACTAVAIKEKQAELTLRGGTIVNCPLANIGTMLNRANDAAMRQEWRQILRKRGQYDMLVVRSDGKLDALDGTFGPGSAAGDAIEFAVSGSDQKLTPKLNRVQGLVFVRKPSADAPPVFCKVTDAAGNLLVVSNLRLDGGAVAIQLVGGGSVRYPALASLNRLDFSKGKLAYLSDLDPLEADQTSTDDLVFPFHRDKNLYGSALRLKGVVYAKGLSLHARTALTYDIGGDYNVFRAVMGVDDVVRSEGGAPVHALVLIEGDGRTLLKAEVRSHDEPKPIAADVKNVRRLKITVSSPLLDLGNQVDFADARVTR